MREAVAQKKVSASGIRSSHPKFSFVTINDPSDAKASSKRKIVRSHAAHYQHSIATLSDPQKGKCRKERRRHRQPVISLILDSDAGVKAREKQAAAEHHHLMISLPIPWVLGGGRVDPFKSYPIPFESYIPTVVDHYLMNIAVDIPELDQPGNHGLIRTRFFPLTMTEAAPFYVVVLIAASHFASVRNAEADAPRLLNLKAKAISAINSALQVPNLASSDQVIAAVAKMASYEAMFGDLEVYKIHMAGLKLMVKLRGGLYALGLDGLLARMLVWIDINAAFVHNLPTFFAEDWIDQEELPLIPNPGQFLGAS